MSDQRITQLNPLAEADVAATDVLPIVDVGASETKKISVKDLAEAGFTIADPGSLNLAKLDQASTTKLGTTALADASITAAKLANGSSIAFGSLEPTTNNFEGRGYVNITSRYLKVWDGSAFQQVIAPTDGIENGSVTTAKLADGVVTTAKVAVSGLGTAALADGSVTTGKIANDAVTAAQLATDAVTADAIAVGAVGASEIAAGAVDSAALASAAVTTAKLADLNVTTDKLANSSVTSDKIAAAAVTYDKLTLTDGVIPGAKLTSASVTSAQLASGSVTTTEIVDDAVTTAKVADDAITSDQLATNSVTADAIAAGAVGTTEIDANAVTYAKLQQTSASNILLGRSSTGAGTVEEVPCTAAGRALLDDADAPAQRATLGLGSLATQDGTFSGTHSGSSSGTNTGDQTITLTGDVTGSGTGTFAATISDDSITTAKIATGAVTTDELGAAAVTGPKLAADSSTVVSGNAPSDSGDFEGQQWLNTNTGLTYVWTGSTWQQTAAIQTITFNDTTPLTFTVAKPNANTAEITTSLDTQTAGTVFAGPATGSAASPTFRTLEASDLPIATTGVNGAVQPGTGLSVTGTGVLNHNNTVAPGTYTKVTVDAQGHISSGAILAASDIPALDASIIGTGQFSSAFLAPNSVTAEQLADNGIAQVSETQPTPEFAGQWWVNPSDRSAYIWVGTVTPIPNGFWLLVGYGSATQLNLRFGGTYNATTNQVVTLNQYGVEAGLVIGQPLTTPNAQNNGVYLIVTTGGTGTTPAPGVTLSTGDWILSQGTGPNWTKIAVVSGASGTFNDYDILCDGTYFTPDMAAVTDVREALALLWDRAQIATTTQIGAVLESTEVLVDNSTGAMSIGTVDDGTY